MDKSYKRNENIDEKIQAVKLPFMAWKVLFLVDEAMSQGQITSLLEVEEAEVNTALFRLVNEGLVFSSISAEPKATAVESATLTETKPVIEEAPPYGEAPAEPSIEELIAEQGIKETFITPPEIIPEEIHFAETPAAETTDLESLLPESLDQTPEAATKEEEFTLEASAESLHAALEAETTGLDVDFAAEVETAVPPPIVPEPEARIPIIPRTSKAVSKKTILVVDDSIVIRKMVEIALEEENFIIETAVSGKEGLTKIDKFNPNLVILDLMLPDINGIDILKTIKASRGIPVIMLSGKDSPQMVEKAKANGADAFLPKPFKDEELIEKIKSLLNEK